MAVNVQPSEQRELSLLGKVEMRIALADSDAKLESILKTYLTPLLLKLASEHVSVRNKVISICQHISTRIKPQSIQLPVAALVNQFKEQESSLIRHFDLMYIQQGLDRMLTKDKAELLPIVVSGISKSGSQGPQIFNVFLRLLEYFILPLRGSKEDADMRTRFGILDDDAKYMANWLGKLILFVPQKSGTGTCAGLHPDQYAFLNMSGKENIWNPNTGGLNLLRTKTLAIKFLGSGIFSDQERFLPALFASADAASMISDAGDDLMKRALPVTDLEDDRLLKTLFGLYFGDTTAPRVKGPLRLKILALLSKSTKSTTFSNDIMRLVNDGISAPMTDGEDVVMYNAPTSASSGREMTRLRSAIFQYISFVARYGSPDNLHAIAPQTIAKLREFIENQGWPKPGQTEDLVSRGYCYEIIGLLVKAGPRTVLVESEHPTLDILRWLFESLGRDTSGNSIVVSIEEALSTVLTALARIELNQEEQGVLEELLIDQMSQSAEIDGVKRIRSTRYVTVRFANRCLPYSSVKARWINILGLGATSDRAEVREEAERGLSPYWYQMLNGKLGVIEPKNMTFPRFDAVVEQFFPHLTSKETPEPLSTARQAKRAHHTCFSYMTAFARHILFQEAFNDAGIPANLDSDWERRVDAATKSDENGRKALRKYLNSTHQMGYAHLQTLMCAIFIGVVDQESTVDSSLIDFLTLAPDTTVQALVPQASHLIPILQSNQLSKHLLAAHTFGILASHPIAESTQKAADVNKLLETIQKWSVSIGATVNKVHGAITALGYYFSRYGHRGQDLRGLPEYNQYLDTITHVVLSSRDKTLLEACYIAIGQLAMFEAVTLATINGVTQLRAVIDKLYGVAKEGNDTAILSLGQLSMILPEEPDNNESDLLYIEEQLHKLHEIRQAEVHFAVGEAFSYVASGWQSTALITNLDIDGPPPQRPDRINTLSRMADRILKDCANTKPALKKAAVIWLLCLVQFCGQENAIQQRLPKFQATFKRCLGDRDELVQETASRGLGLVYEKGDRKVKDDLVRDLVSSFSSDRQSQLAGSVSADTQLFEPGVLPTGDGSVSTYKDIMSLASEVGDSSLVYKFMSMASSNAIWSSRAAFGRFGLSNVLFDSSADAYLTENPKLYPKLFRYRFDPNGAVQRAMSDIWNSLVKDSTATIDKYFDDIMEDLLLSILGKEWRVRQASCAAMADLIQGRTLDRYEKYLERIWTQCFKVLDDIKESVRTSAASLARTLTGVLTRALEADHSSAKNASAMLKHVLPFLLSSSGMESSAQDVQAFSVHTLLEIIKKASAHTLRPFIAELVERLLGSLSSLEPEAVNYLHLNASKYNLTEQKIDDMRLSSIRSSPLMEAIERCLDLLDESTMRELQPRLENIMKTAVGLPSKVGASRVLVSLSTRRMPLFRPFADVFLKMIEKVVLDRNETVSSSYAFAAGYIARTASDKQLLRLFEFTKKLYFETEGDRESVTPKRAISSGEIIFATAKHASDRFNALAASVLPFVFVAKHDPNDYVKEQFQNAWDEAVGGSRAISLYLPEIVDLSAIHLESPQWVLKHTSARSVADATNTVAILEPSISPKSAETLWPALEKAMGGKTWDGKEVVLYAFAKFAETAFSWYSERPSISSTIMKIATREAKRQNVTYRQHSIKCLGRICLARRDLDASKTVFEIVEPILTAGPPDDLMEVDGEQGAERIGEARQATLASAIESLFASINPAVLNGDNLPDAASRAFDMVLGAQDRLSPVQRSIYSSLIQLFGRIGDAGQGDNIWSDNCRKRLAAILFGRHPSSEALRLLRADAIVQLVKLSPTHATALAGEILALQQDESATAVRERLASAPLPRAGGSPAPR